MRLIQAIDGGEDSGAVGNNGLYEKNVNLVVAYLVKEHLEAAGHTVMMTRTSDVWYGPGVSADLNTRCQKINDWGADIAVSIHVNSGGGHYISTFIQGTGGEAEKLAKAVQAAMVAAIGWQDAGVKVANLAMTRETVCPACLVEMGFIDDAAQEASLGTTETQKAFARAIASGIIGYLGGTLTEGGRKTVKINIHKDGGEVLYLDGHVENGVTYAPVRQVVEAMGGMVTANGDYSVIDIQADPWVVEMDGKKIPGLAVLNRGYVALRELTAMYGYKTGLDKARKTITLDR